MPYYAGRMLASKIAYYVEILPAEFIQAEFRGDNEVKAAWKQTSQDALVWQGK